MKDKQESKKSSVFLIILLSFCVLVFCSAVWYIEIFGRTGFDSVIFTLFVGTENSNPVFFKLYFLYAVLPAAAASAVICTAVFLPLKSKQFLKKLISLLLCAVLIISSFAFSGLLGYFVNSLRKTDIYEKDYADPKTADISFPEKKKNLIHIFLESTETTFMSKSEGGALDKSASEELYRLAKDNTNFSDTSGVGGGYAMPSCTWTTAALTAYTTGLPLKLGFKNGEFCGDILKGRKSITDILSENGYDLSLMVGSPVEYGLRKELFENHSVKQFYDKKTAVDDKIIPEDYNVNWGFEDKKLFEYAKQVILKKSQSDKPFAFYMLTADTHHPDGYLCEDCPDSYGEKYENVLRCSAKKVSEFVSWIKEQDFYEDTVIVITGDHLSMANMFIKKNVDEDYQRRVYNCIINSTVSDGNSKNRTFTTLDMFPTVLRSLGCKIGENRLGLGTDLYSGKKTLAEAYGIKKFKKELSKSSDFYYD